ncbi:unnamed protein product [Adineta steineri]|uniref:Uncharacterized protein n=1 Tax=Adineta steineri TaxID=433720 RepID=A0A815Z1N2_9BILA|nr:unnamed protein product [Adineta steineri]CAF1578425.1 unnamed protein product [Adineta steineri]
MRAIFYPCIGSQQIPGFVFNNQDYEGPRTIFAPAAIRAHIKSFHQLFIMIAFLLMMITFGILTIIIGYSKRYSCSASYSAPTILIAFGKIDLIICSIIIIIVCNYTNNVLPQSKWSFMWLDFDWTLIVVYGIFHRTCYYWR